MSTYLKQLFILLFLWQIFALIMILPKVLSTLVDIKCGIYCSPEIWNNAFLCAIYAFQLFACMNLMNLTTTLPRVGSFYLLTVAWVPILGPFVAMRALRLIRSEIERQGNVWHHHLTHFVVGFFYYFNIFICILLVLVALIWFLVLIFYIGEWGFQLQVERILGKNTLQSDSTLHFLYHNYSNDMRLFYHHHLHSSPAATQKIEFFQIKHIPPVAFHHLKKRYTGATFTLRDYQLNSVKGADSVWREFTEGKSIFRKGYLESSDSSHYEIMFIRSL